MVLHDGYPAGGLISAGMDQGVRLGKLDRNHSLNSLPKPSSDAFSFAISPIDWYILFAWFIFP
jgi:hypothetical protein